MTIAMATCSSVPTIAAQMPPWSSGVVRADVGHGLGGRSSRWASAAFPRTKVKTTTPVRAATRISPAVVTRAPTTRSVTAVRSRIVELTGGQHHQERDVPDEPEADGPTSGSSRS